MTLVVVFALLLSATQAQNSDPKKILTVGDSWSEYSGNTFSDYCDGAIQINKGVGGSEAVQWAAGGKFAGRDVNYAKALAAAGTMNGNDIIVVSVGGNDWMGDTGKCGQIKTQATLQTEIQNSVNVLIQAVKATGCANDCPKIHMFGYAMVTNTAQDGCVGAGGTAALAPLLKSIVNVAAATPEITYTDITTMCGGTKTSHSPEFPCFGMRYAHDNSVDNIHMNKEGYCLLITKPAIQTAFGCKAKTYNCATEDRDLTRAFRKSTECHKYPCSASPALTCKDNDAGVKEASSGQILTCADLAPAGYPCNHEVHEATIKSLCPVTCKAFGCNSATKCCAQEGVIPAGIFAQQTPDPKKILTVGDSWSEFSGNTFTDYCDGAIQINKGVGGSTAVGWAAGGVFHGRDVNYAKALAAAGTMNGNDIMVVSVGGNYYIGLNPPCVGKTQATLQGEIQNSLNVLIQAVKATGCGNDCPKIHMFGYAMVTAGNDGCAPQGPGPLLVLQKSVSGAAAATPEITYTDITTMCGGTKTSLSPEFPCFGMSYGTSKDNIHMNKEGYCLLITKPAIQTAFGCKAKTYNCPTEDRDLTRAFRKSTECHKYPCSASPISPPPTDGTCQDNDAGVKSASDSAFSACSQLEPAGFGCDHTDHGATIKSLCPVMCKCAAPKCCAQEGVIPAGILIEKQVSHMEVDAIVPESEVTML
jgi:hypothetical protein